MNNCEQAKLLIQDYCCGEITLPNFAELRSHIDSCEYCRALIEIHFETSSEESMPMVTDLQLQNMRSKVMQQIAKSDPDQHLEAFQENELSDKMKVARFNQTITSLSKHSTGMNKSSPGRSRFSKFMAYGFATAAMLMVAVLAGRWSVTFEQSLLLNQVAGQDILQGDGLLNNNVLISQLRRFASSQNTGQNLQEDYWNTPVTYTNVSFDTFVGNNLKLGFDVCKRVDMTAKPDSGIAKQVLLHAILNPTTLGGQLKAMQIAATTHDKRLVEALTLTMHNHPALPVRIEVLSILSRLPLTDVIEKAFLTTLREDSAVTMRLMALDYLSQYNNLRNGILLETIQQGSQNSAAALIQALQQQPTNMQRIPPET